MQINREGNDKEVTGWIGRYRRHVSYIYCLSCLSMYIITTLVNSVNFRFKHKLKFSQLSLLLITKILSGRHRHWVAISNLLDLLECSTRIFVSMWPKVYISMFTYTIYGLMSPDLSLKVVFFFFLFLSFPSLLFIPSQADFLCKDR